MTKAMIDLLASDEVYVSKAIDKCVGYMIVIEDEESDSYLTTKRIMDCEEALKVFDHALHDRPDDIDLREILCFALANIAANEMYANKVMKSGIFGTLINIIGDDQE